MATEQFEKVRYSDEELQEFKAVILQKLEKAKEDYEQLRAAITHSASNGTEDNEEKKHESNCHYNFCCFSHIMNRKS